MKQRTPEWFQARCGIITASRIHDVIAGTGKCGASSKPAVSRENYIAELVLERHSGIPQENGYISPAMQAGIDREDQIRAIYITDHPQRVKECGLILHP